MTQRICERGNYLKSLTTITFIQPYAAHLGANEVKGSLKKIEFMDDMIYPKIKLFDLES